MKRQLDTSITTKVYTYGCVPARVAKVHNEDLAIDQMRLANRLWNVLVAIERTRIEAYRRTMRDETQERIDELRAEAGRLRDEMKARRKAVRKRSVDIDDLRARLAAIKAEVRKLIEHQKETRDARHEAKRSELTAIQDRANRRAKRARQAAGQIGLFWGTYNDIVQRADAARKHGGEMHFRSFRGEGTLTAQIMGGALVERCVDGNHTFFQIDGAVDRQRWRYARMRISSAEDRSPIWMEIPIVYHRDLPPHGMIKSVSITRRLLAGKVRWQLNVTVNTAVPQVKEYGAAIAIDIGWRLLPEGVRVGYWVDQAGKQGQVMVPSRDLCQFERVRTLRSTCDLKRDEFLPALVAWTDGQILPQEWAERAAFLAQWRSSDRLAGLVAWWREHRLPADEEVYESAVIWRREYLHLANWWRNLQDQLVLRLRDHYRVFAAEVAREYSALYIEDFDLREVAHKPRAEDEEEKSASPTYRQIASPSMCRRALLNACSREGVRIVKLPAEYTTRQCHLCGYAGVWNQAESVVHRCEQCHELWDQDENAARNLLDLGLKAEPSEAVSA